MDRLWRGRDVREGFAVWGDHGERGVVLWGEDEGEGDPGNGHGRELARRGEIAPESLEEVGRTGGRGRRA